MSPSSLHAVKPDLLFFKDDGHIPNNRLPVLIYRQALRPTGADLGAQIEQRFIANHWTGTWRDGIYNFLHYQSTSHEVLGVAAGHATLRLGGNQGEEIKASAGDVIVLPAGVGHHNLGASSDFAVIGGYPHGRTWNTLRGLPGERPQADHEIEAVPRPDTDPLYGSKGPLLTLWTVTQREQSP